MKEPQQDLSVYSVAFHACKAVTVKACAAYRTTQSSITASKWAELRRSFLYMEWYVMRIAIWAVCADSLMRLFVSMRVVVTQTDI